MAQGYVVLGADHAGYPLKERISAALHEQGYECEDVGTHSTESCDYPEFASRACRRVLEREVPGILICGSGLGMSMSANRFSGIRAALCGTEYAAKMARGHNDANVLCLGARIIGEDLAWAIVEAFLGTGFQGGRHAKRVELMDSLGSS